MSTVGLQDRAIAIIARWRIPPESWWGYSVSRLPGSAMPTRSSISTASDLASARDLPRCSRIASAIWSPIVNTGLRLVIGS